MCFFEEWGPLFAGASNVGREERSRKESDDTSYDVFVGRFETSVFESRGSDVKKKTRFVFLFFQERVRKLGNLGRDVPRCTFGNPYGLLLVGVFGRSREMNDARRFPAPKKIHARVSSRERC